jgi:methylmalonyl-CoA/ethylmalonyl-CoA epimerase
MITRIHHVAVVVRDLEASLGFWRDTLELPVLRSADLAEQGVRAALLACGTAEVEVIAPLDGTDTGVSRFLESRGEGLHHVCFESDDVVKEVRRFIGTGVDMVDGKPRPGLAGKVAFVQPRACAKLLVELATPSTSGASLPETSLAVAAIHAKVDDVEAGAQRFRDLFGMRQGFAGEDGSFSQLVLGEVVLQLTPIGGGFPKPGLTVLRLRSGDLSALRRRLGERDVPCEENAVGLVVAPGPGRGAPLIVEPVR